MAIKFLNAQTIEGQLTVINTSGGDEVMAIKYKYSTQEMLP